MIFKMSVIVIYENHLIYKEFFVSFLRGNHNIRVAHKNPVLFIFFVTEQARINIY